MLPKPKLVVAPTKIPWKNTSRSTAAALRAAIERWRKKRERNTANRDFATRRQTDALGPELDDADLYDNDLPNRNKRGGGGEGEQKG